MKTDENRGNICFIEFMNYISFFKISYYPQNYEKKIYVNITVFIFYH